MCKNQNVSFQGLQFNVAQLLKEGTGATRSYDIAMEVNIELDEDATIVSPLTGQVRFLSTGRDILATGLLQATIEKSCGRCLTAFSAPVTIELEEEFYPSVDVVTGMVLPAPVDADEANQIDEHHILDLGEVVRQEFLLEGNSIRYCRPDCQGLCPHCGQDRNTGTCNCQEDKTDLRWAGLRELQLEE